VGVYRIVERIGRGGMSELYRAEHTRAQRSVALKVLRPHLADDDRITQRFKEEARAVARIGHPQLVQIYDMVHDPQQDPPVYIVMELLQGQSLGRVLATRGPLDPLETIFIGVQVARVLKAVHAAHYIHRDLKPDNIFLLQEAQDDKTVKLLDFSASKFLEGPPVPALTAPGKAVGTPRYMAPEQVLDQKLDQRTDIHGLGAVLYEMLAGRGPHDARSYGEMTIRLVKDRPKPIAHYRRDLPPVPPALEAVVMRCLEKEPALRFQSMGTLAMALAASMGPGAPPASSG
jgi:serine/threonine-protein kinase